MLGEIKTQKNLVELLAGFGISGAVPDVRITDLVLDSRQVTPGALFAACAGANRHGLEFADRAAAAGAAAIVWEPEGQTAPALHVPGVAVAELSRRLGEIAARLYDRPSSGLFTTGVTGTDGKTSCAWLLSRALENLGVHCGYLGTLGFGALDDLAAASHTTPDAARLHRWLARMRDAGQQAVAMEVSSHALAQGRVATVAFDAAVLTRIGRDHLDYHGSEQAYVAAKRRLFDADELSWAVLNADDAVGRKWLDRPAEGAARIAYGRDSAVVDYARFVHIAAVDANTQGLVADFYTHRGRVQVASPLIGVFNVYNLAATLAVLLTRDALLRDVAVALGAVATVPGRMERVDTRDGQPLVIVDYAHTPDALAAALEALGPHVAGRLLCVFGCGGERDRGKRPLMGAAVARRANHFWITDDNPRGEAPDAIVADVIAGIPPAVMAAERCEIVHDRAAAIAAAIAAAGPNDAVLIAGKGHERSQQYDGELRDFDDRKTARSVLEAA